jgi:hypothetical protein
MTPYIWSVLIALALASAFHGVTEHHWHRQLWQCVQPGVFVPQPRHDTRWHGMSHPRRLLWTAVLLAAALLAGYCWTLQPAAAVLTFVFAAVIVVTAIAARAGSRSIGERRPGPPGRRNRKGGKR